MFKEFIGRPVTLLVASKSDNNGVMEFAGVLESENDECLVLRNVSIRILTMQMQRSLNMFGNAAFSIKENIDKAVVAKSFVFACM